MPIFSRFFSNGRGERPGLPYPPHSPEGLAARWVQWVAGVGMTHSPVDDPSGADAGVNQPGDVWFLAGTFGGKAERRCPVPAGLPLFVPAFNMWHTNAEGPPPRLPKAYGHLIVDGAKADLDVIATPVPFLVAGAPDNPVTGTDRQVPTTVWGLWKRLEPFPPGRHEVGFSGGDGYGFTVTVTYQLDVG
jgi:hypothetical protein